MVCYCSKVVGYTSDARRHQGDWHDTLISIKEQVQMPAPLFFQPHPLPIKHTGQIKTFSVQILWVLSPEQVIWENMSDISGKWLFHQQNHGCGYQAGQLIFKNTSFCAKDKYMPFKSLKCQRKWEINCILINEPCIMAERPPTWPNRSFCKMFVWSQAQCQRLNPLKTFCHILSCHFEAAKKITWSGRHWTFFILTNFVLASL